MIQEGYISRAVAAGAVLFALSFGWFGVVAAVEGPSPLSYFAVQHGEGEDAIALIDGKTDYHLSVETDADAATVIFGVTDPNLLVDEDFQIRVDGVDSSALGPQFVARGDELVASYAFPIVFTDQPRVVMITFFNGDVPIIYTVTLERTIPQSEFFDPERVTFVIPDFIPQNIEGVDAPLYYAVSSDHLMINAMVDGVQNLPQACEASITAQGFMESWTDTSHVLDVLPGGNYELMVTCDTGLNETTVITKTYILVFGDASVHPSDERVIPGADIVVTATLTSQDAANNLFPRFGNIAEIRVEKDGVLLDVDDAQNAIERHEDNTITVHNAQRGVYAFFLWDKANGRVMSPVVQVRVAEEGFFDPAQIVFAVNGLARHIEHDVEREISVYYLLPTDDITITTFVGEQEMLPAVCQITLSSEESSTWFESSHHVGPLPSGFYGVVAGCPTLQMGWVNLSIGGILIFNPPEIHADRAQATTGDNIIVSSTITSDGLIWLGNLAPSLRGIAGIVVMKEGRRLDVADPANGIELHEDNSITVQHAQKGVYQFFVWDMLNDRAMSAPVDVMVNDAVVAEQPPQSGGGGGGFASPVPTNLFLDVVTSSFDALTNSILVRVSADQTPIQMVFSTNSQFTNAIWQPYATSTRFVLPQGTAGTTTVYARFRNASGVSQTIRDEFVLTRPPQRVLSERVVACSLETDKPYKVAGNPGVYYVTTSCTKRAIKNAPIYFSYFLSWQDIRTVTEAELRAIADDMLGFLPWGPRYNPHDGALVKVTSDPKVYLLLGSNRFWITSEETFNALYGNASWRLIEDIDPRLLANYAEGTEVTRTDKHPNYTIVKYAGNVKVYRLEPSATDPSVTVKRHIANEEAFNGLGYRWDRIFTIPDTEVYPDGEILEAGMTIHLRAK